MNRSSKVMHELKLGLISGLTRLTTSVDVGKNLRPAVRWPAGKCGLFTWLVIAAVFPLIGQIEVFHDSDGKDKDGRNQSIDLVLYSGPLIHDTTWTLTRGTNTNVFRGQCSMIPSNVSNIAGSASEVVRFSAEPADLGIWDMVWTDTITGKAMATTGQHYRYFYRGRITFAGPTTDGRAPAISRTTPSATDEGFLRSVPSNVNAPSFDVRDFFVLQDEVGGNVVAHSEVLWRERLKITPDEQPPALYPFVDFGRYILATPQQLAGQLGCDPV